MENRVLTLQTEEIDVGAETPVMETRPIVPGANFVTRETPDLCVAYGRKVRGTNTKFTHETYAILTEMKQAGHSGLYTVFADKATLDKIGNGKKLKDFVAESVSNKRDWPVYRCDGTKPDPDDPGEVRAFKGRVIRFKTQAPADDASVARPWKIDGMTITKAWPSIPGSLGPVDLVEVAAKLTADIL